MCLDPHLNWGWGWRRWAALGPPVECFTDRSKAVLLLWIFYVFVLSCVCYVFVNLSSAATQEDNKLVFQTNYRLVKVLSIAECFKSSILQYFLLSMCLDPHLN